MARHTIILLSLGHLVTDINQGALPALLPFLIAEYGLTYTAAGFLIFASNITSSVVQPVFGHLGDRRSWPWLLPAGIVLAGTGLAATGLVPGYGWILVAVMLSGVGVAAFHPQGARIVNDVAGSRKGMAMSVFGVGGTLGFAIGPALVTAALLHWGLPGTAILAVPTAVLALLIGRHESRRPIGEGPGGAAGSATAHPENRDAWWPFTRLAGAVVARAVLFYSFNTFIPLYWIYTLNQSKAAAASALTLFAFAGVAGNLVGGRLADRFGPTRIAVAGFLLLLPLVPVLVAVPSTHAALPVLMLIGLTLSTTYSPLVILGQAYLPNHVGLSAGVTLGIAVSIGGVATPVLGRVADHYGLWAALAVLGFVPPLSAALALTLPQPQPRRPRSTAGV
jgi:FSR family fosmidomycin resistance protein-like MFS transporter